MSNVEFQISVVKERLEDSYQVSGVLILTLNWVSRSPQVIISGIILVFVYVLIGFDVSRFSRRCWNVQTTPRLPHRWSIVLWQLSLAARVHWECSPCSTRCACLLQLRPVCPLSTPSSAETHTARSNWVDRLGHNMSLIWNGRLSTMYTYCSCHCLLTHSSHSTIHPSHTSTLRWR